MKERSILFSAPMVRAILDGRKTVTRRVVKGEALEWLEQGFTPGFVADYQNNLCPYGQPGDRLWVKETHYAWGHWTKRYNAKKRREEWHFVDETIGTGKAYRYDADEQLPRRKRELHEVGWWKRPAIFMPRAASRILPEVTAVRVERLQDISDTECVREGITPDECTDCDGWVNAYSRLWESINGPGSWEANPWVWVIEFKRVEAA